MGQTENKEQDGSCKPTISINTYDINQLKVTDCQLG